MFFSGLELVNVNHSRGDWTLSVNLHLEKGSLNGLLGASGAGKSTLLSLIAGFEGVTSGQILFEGHEISHLPPKDRPVSIIFQEHNLFPHLSAFQNALLGLNPRLKATSMERQKVCSALAKVGLQGKEERLPKNLSGGERQRVAIARSLVMRRPVLLLDEPFTALGPALREEMLELVKSLSQEHNLTVLLVSHAPDEILRFADKTVFLHDGQVLTYAPTQQVLEQSTIPAIANYLKYRQ